MELDALYWKSTWTSAPVAVFRERARHALSGETWVVDGNHPEARDIVWGRADLLVWLDYSPWQVLRRIVEWPKVEVGEGWASSRALPGRTSTLVEAARALLRRWRADAQLAFSLNGLEQLRPQVVHLGSPQAARRWLSHFTEARARWDRRGCPRV